MQKIIAFIKTSLALKIILGLIVFYFAFAYFAVNPIAKRLIPWVAQKHLASQARVSAVKFDPLALTLTANDFKLSTNAGETLMSFNQLLIDLEANGVFDWAWKFKTIQLDKPFLHVAINEAGLLNWADLMKQLNQDKKEPDTDQLPRVVLQQININQGDIEYQDAHREQPLEFKITPLDFALSGISTLPKDGGEYLISAKLPEQEGEIRWNGEISINPLASKGKLNLHHIDLPKVLKLAKNLPLPITLEDGVLDIASDYDFSIEEIEQTEADKKAGIVPIPPKTNIALKNIVLSLNKLQGVLTNEQVLSNENLNVSASAVTIDIQDTVRKTAEGLTQSTPSTNAVVQEVAFTLDGFATGLSSERAISSEKLSIKVPQVTVHLKEQADVSFEALSATIDQFVVNQTNQALDTNFTLPHLALNDVSFKLTDHLLLAKQLTLENSLFETANDKQKMLFVPLAQANTMAYDLAKNQLTVKDIQFNQGELNAHQSEAGLMNWLQAFISQPSLASSNKIKTNTEDAMHQDASSLSHEKVSVIEPDTSQKIEPQTTLPSAHSSTLPKAESTDEKELLTETPSFSMQLANIQLNDWRTRYQDDSFVHPLNVYADRVDIALAVNLTEAGTVIDQLSSQLKSIKAVSAFSAQPIITLDALNLAPSTIDVGNQSITLPSLIGRGLTTSLIQEKSKPLNWLAILEQHVTRDHPSAKADQASSSEDKPWQFALKQFKLADSRIHVEDRTPQHPLILDLAQINLAVANISHDLTKALPANLSLKVKQGGALNIQAKVSPSPIKTDLTIKLDQLTLKPFAPYINEFALLKLMHGTASIDGQLAIKDDATMATAFKGAARIDQLMIVEETADVPFLSWDSVRANKLSFTSAPNLLNIDSLDIIKPAGKFIIHEDKTTNISRILRYDATAQAAVAPAKNTLETHPTTEKPSEAAFPIRIAKTRIENGALEFADLSLQLKFGTKIQQLKGIINQISTDPTATTKVALNGQVDEYGVANINGAIKPFSIKDFTDMKLNFKNIEMNRLTPYSGEFAGRKIKSGKMSVNLVYNINAHQLDGKNKFVINKLVLGDKIKSPNAADLPLDLAIAILEDNNGVIDLNLPVSGSLDDPQFSIGGLVWKTFANIMTKVVTAPFKVLGNLLGGGDKDLASVSFDAGKASIAPPELEKLHALSEMLTKRDSLTLAIHPHFNKTTDSRALQEMLLRQKVSEGLDIPISEGEEAEPIDLQNEETQKVIQALYDEMTGKSFYNRMKDKLKKPEAGHYQTLQEALIVGTEMTEQALQHLANKRAEIIKKALEDDGISTTRITLEKPTASDAQSIEATFSIGAKDTDKSIEPKQQK